MQHACFNHGCTREKTECMLFGGKGTSMHLRAVSIWEALAAARTDASLVHAAAGGARLAPVLQRVSGRDGGAQVVLQEGEVDARAHREDVQQVEQRLHLRARKTPDTLKTPTGMPVLDASLFRRRSSSELLALLCIGLSRPYAART